jgi:hypothetical protein
MIWLIYCKKLVPYVKVLGVLLCPTKSEAIGDGVGWGGVPESQSESQRIAYFVAGLRNR